MALLPKKYQSRKAEITTQFIEEIEKHITSIVAGETDVMYHIKDIAGIMHIHPVHLSNTIKLHTGKAPCFFFEERILTASKNLLDNTTLSITEIANRLTYDNSNFTKFFKRFTGYTPGQYRAKSLEVAL
ncbi:AraC family transcriptional regulator [Chitinophaga silvatica]|uniref:AraC family transcriptional regulator n=1 Tax=Chitinophaga silvatica TaxID=2282649 RepID=A0A3E1Y974_9BACT|nr:helix-turn-helix domain-containing protein [Chitinophaga silvatica]RFS21968.1 AraC family transcriptional regulator [Chitinophaga silvatica]